MGYWAAVLAFLGPSVKSTWIWLRFHCYAYFALTVNSFDRLRARFFANDIILYY